MGLGEEPWIEKMTSPIHSIPAGMWAPFPTCDSPWAEPPSGHPDLATLGSHGRGLPDGLPLGPWGSGAQVADQWSFLALCGGTELINDPQETWKPDRALQLDNLTDSF